VITKGYCCFKLFLQVVFYNILYNIIILYYITLHCIPVPVKGVQTELVVAYWKYIEANVANKSK